MSSIDSTSAPVQIPPATRKPSIKKPDNEPLGTNNKRKAEDDLSRPGEKVSKVVVSQSRKPAPGNATTTSTPQSMKGKQSDGSGLEKKKDGPQTLNPTPSSSKPPKKGSFADIMARGKQQVTQIGTINHKPKEKLGNKKELATERELAKNKALKSQTNKGGIASKGIDRNGSAARGSDMASKKHMNSGKGLDKNSKPAGYQGTGKSASKGQPVSGYSGTAKPKPGYQGTSKGSGTAVSRNKPHYSDSDRPLPKGSSTSRGRARDDYDEPDEYESEDPYDYASEDYSDMDAGFDDMEEEDAMAERLARKEDAKEQAELERLKREKERKKAMLAGGKSKR